ncbi:hypothetical protein ACSFV5_07325 [Acinetobacter sp. HC8-3S]
MENKTELKKQAYEMFDKELADQIVDQINESGSKKKREQPIELENGVFLPKDLTDRTASLIQVDDWLYDDLSVGKFTAYCETETLPGKDNHFFKQSLDEPFFSYITSKGRVITPNSMRFNGGSIPYVMRVFKKFSPSYFMPAYLIHDWLFDRHRENEAPDHDFTFEETAEILAEAIKTLMEIRYYEPDGKTLVKLDKSETVLYLIYLAVKTPIARAIWNNH